MKKIIFFINLIILFFFINFSQAKILDNYFYITNKFKIKLSEGNWFEVRDSMGDVGFGMTVSELSTAVNYGINTITIVMNNQSWGAEKAYQKDFFGKRYIGADISSPLFDKVA